MNNDFEFSIRLLDHAAGVRFAPEAIIYYRQGRSGTLSKNLSRKALKSAWLATTLGCERILAHGADARQRKLCADRMQDWLFRFYPGHPDLAADAEAEILRLGGSDQPLKGGRVLSVLSRFLSWKQIRLLQEFAYRFGWKIAIKIKNRRAGSR